MHVFENIGVLPSPSLGGMLKKTASGVLGLLSYSRTTVYAPRAKSPAALLDLTPPIGFAQAGGLFEHSTSLLQRIKLGIK